MSNITGTISGQRLQITTDLVLAGDSINYLSAAFNFSSDWNGVEKWAHFSKDETVYDVALAGDAISPTQHLNLTAGIWQVYLHGDRIEDGEVTQRITTNIARFSVSESGVLDGEPLPEIPATAAEQILAKAAQALKLANDDQNAAAQAAATATERAATAVQSAADAEDSATNAEQSATRAEQNILNGVATHDADNAAHPDIRADLRQVEAIARGRATAYTFDTLAELTEWLAVADNTEKLVKGDNLYIRDLGVRDFWWDGSAAQVLESECPDLTDYYTKAQVDAVLPIVMSQTAYDALAAAGGVEAGRIYFITTEYA